jgi:hypothetical protein
MYIPPLDPRDDPVTNPPTPRGVLAIYAMLAAVPLLLWLVSQPVTGAVAVVTTAGIVIGARRTAGLVRCFRECGGLAFDLCGSVRICVTQPQFDNAC